MARTDDIILELKELSEPTHRSAVRIHEILVNNRKALQKMEAENYQHLLAAFEKLADATGLQYQSPEFRSDFERAHGLLRFHLERI